MAKKSTVLSDELNNELKDIWDGKVTKNSAKAKKYEYNADNDKAVNVIILDNNTYTQKSIKSAWRLVSSDFREVTEYRGIKFIGYLATGLPAMPKFGSDGKTEINKKLVKAILKTTANPANVSESTETSETASKPESTETPADKPTPEPTPAPAPEEKPEEVIDEALVFAINDLKESFEKLSNKEKAGAFGIVPEEVITRFFGSNENYNKLSNEQKAKLADSVMEEFIAKVEQSRKDSGKADAYRNLEGKLKGVHPGNYPKEEDFKSKEEYEKAVEEHRNAIKAFEKENIVYFAGLQNSAKNKKNDAVIKVLKDDKLLNKTKIDPKTKKHTHEYSLGSDALVALWQSADLSKVKEEDKKLIESNIREAFELRGVNGKVLDAILVPGNARKPEELPENYNRNKVKTAVISVIAGILGLALIITVSTLGPKNGKLERENKGYQDQITQIEDQITKIEGALETEENGNVTTPKGLTEILNAINKLKTDLSNKDTNYNTLMNNLNQLKTDVGLDKDKSFEDLEKKVNELVGIETALDGNKVDDLLNAKTNAEAYAKGILEILSKLELTADETKSIENTVKDIVANINKKIETIQNQEATIKAQNAVLDNVFEKASISTTSFTVKRVGEDGNMVEVKKDFKAGDTAYYGEEEFVLTESGAKNFNNTETAFVKRTDFENTTDATSVALSVLENRSGFLKKVIEADMNGDGTAETYEILVNSSQTTAEALNGITLVLKSTYTELENNYNNAVKDAEDKGSKLAEAEKTVEKYNTLIDQLTNLKNTHNLNDIEVATIDAEIAKLIEGKQSAEAERDKAIKEKGIADAEVEKIRGEKDSVATQLEEANSTITTLNETIEKLQNENDSLKEEVLNKNNTQNPSGNVDTNENNGNSQVSQGGGSTGPNKEESGAPSGELPNDPTKIPENTEENENSTGNQTSEEDSKEEVKDGMVYENGFTVMYSKGKEVVRWETPELEK